MNQPERIIIISGASSAAGKTALVTALIGRLREPAPAAVKITVTHDQVKGCPRGGNGCGVCASVTSGYRVVTAPEVISQPGTDTGRFMEAGARPVFWIIAQPNHLAQAWDEVEDRLGTGRCIVVESNSLALLRPAGLTFFTVNPRVARTRWKDSAAVLGARSDILIVSQQAGADVRAEALFAEFRMLRGHLPTFLLPSVEAAIELPEVEQRFHALSRMS